MSSDTKVIRLSILYSQDQRNLDQRFSHQKEWKIFGRVSKMLGVASAIERNGR